MTTEDAARPLPRPPVDAGAPVAQGSLFGEILDWMLAPLLLIWPISVALTWLVAQGIASRPYDRELGEMARSLGQQVAAASAPAKGRDRYALAPEAAALLRADASDTVFYQVLGARGELLSGDATLPVPAEDATAAPWEWPTSAQGPPARSSSGSSSAASSASRTARPAGQAGPRPAPCASGAST